MATPKRRVVCAVLVALSACVHGAAAQSISSSITGTVVDQTRQLVPGATVTLVNEQTADTRAISSNEISCGGRSTTSSTRCSSRRSTRPPDSTLPAIR